MVEESRELGEAISVLWCSKCPELLNSLITLTYTYSLILKTL